MKKFLMVALASSMLVTSALADEVFSSQKGLWTIKGYANNPDPTDVSCVISTTWSEVLDINQLNINIFPHVDGSQNATLTMREARWNGHGESSAKKWKSKVRFISNNGLRVDNLPIVWQWYPNNNDQTIIARNISQKMSQFIVESETMVLFPDTQGEITVSLKGTRQIVQDLSDCIDQVSADFNK